MYMLKRAGNGTPLHEGADGEYFARLTLGALAVFILAMTLHPWLANVNLDHYGDMVENYAWGMNWPLGTHKHPPLFAWITAAWFKVFPRTDFYYYLLSAVNAGAALILVWRIALRYVSPAGALLAAAIGMCLPPIYFLGITYNANCAMTPFWAAIFLVYLRLIEKPNYLDAALLGLFAGLAMLTKYFSVVLILALFIHALREPALRRLVLGPLFAVTFAVFLAVTLPHILWLLRHEFLPITYAAGQGRHSLVRMVRLAAEFPIALILYCLPGYLILLALWRPGDPSLENLKSPFRILPQSVEGRALLYAMLVSILLTFVLAFAAQADLNAVWALPLYFGVPVLMARQVPDDMAAARWKSGMIALAAFLAISIAVAPQVRRMNLDHADYFSALPLREIVAEVETEWHQYVPGDDTWHVAGKPILANSMSFYGSGRWVAIQDMSYTATPWAAATANMQPGLLGLCFEGDETCLTRFRALAVRVDEESVVKVAAVPGTRGPAGYTVRMLIRKPGTP